MGRTLCLPPLESLHNLIQISNRPEIFFVFAADWGFPCKHRIQSMGFECGAWDCNSVGILDFSTCPLRASLKSNLNVLENDMHSYSVQEAQEVNQNG